MRTKAINELYQMQNCLARFSDLTLKSDPDLHGEILDIGASIWWLQMKLEARQELARVNKKIVDMRPIFEHIRGMRG